MYPLTYVQTCDLFTNPLCRAHYVNLKTFIWYTIKCIEALKCGIYEKIRNSTIKNAIVVSSLSQARQKPIETVIVLHMASLSCSTSMRASIPYPGLGQLMGK